MQAALSPMRYRVLRRVLLLMTTILLVGSSGEVYYNMCWYALQYTPAAPARCSWTAASAPAWSTSAPSAARCTCRQTADHYVLDNVLGMIPGKIRQLGVCGNWRFVHATMAYEQLLQPRVSQRLARATLLVAQGGSLHHGGGSLR